MAATAYASLVSLMSVLNRIEHHSCPAFFEKNHIKSFLAKVACLIDFLEKDSKQRSSETEDLARSIADVALAAEDLIETYVAQQIKEGGQKKEEAYAVIRDDLQKAIDKMDSIFEAAMKIKEVQCENGDDQLPEFSQTSGSSSTKSILKDSMVGFDDYMPHLQEQLFSSKRDRVVIPIVGMGGIGKTTLAIHTCEIVGKHHHFDRRGWVTVSQNCRIKEVFLYLLRDLGNDVDKLSQMASEKLGVHLHKSLYEVRYLLVLDDIWSTKDWLQITKYIPANKNGSRILVTTRLLEVAKGISGCTPLEIRCLDDKMSWVLLSRKVFGQGECPRELVEYGKQISRNCNGLPLAIVVIGGVMSKKPTKEFWASVVKDLESNVRIDKDEHCLKILSLSYNYLPIHLKPCFLYMATFRKGISIKTSELALLWVAKGFLKPRNDNQKTLEEIALEYMSDLISRNLIMVGKRGSSGKVNWCMVHDVLNDLCVSEANTEGFMDMLKEGGLLNHPQQKESDFHLVNHRAFIKVSPSLSSYEEQKVHVLYSYFECLLASIHMIPNVRLFIATKYGLDANSSYIPSTISSLWNLDTLVVNELDANKVSLPSEIWKLAHLRNLVFARMVILPDPVDDAQNEDGVLKNLQTLSTILNFNGTDKVYKKIPNLKRLGIYYDMLEASQSAKVSRCFKNMQEYLHKLETFKCTFARGHKINRGCPFNKLDAIKLPDSLKKLVLSGSMIPWEYMSIIGSLPNLEVLKLRDNAFCGEEWTSKEGEFPRLKYLSIDGCFLEIWIMECSHFPELQHLNLRRLRLQFIPEPIGEIETLESIELEYCETGTIMMAYEMLVERKQNGNDDLFIQVTVRPWDCSSDVEDLKRIDEKFLVQDVPTRGKLRFKEMARSRINEWRELVGLCSDAPDFLLRFLSGVFLKTKEFQKILEYYSNMYAEAVLDKILMANETESNNVLCLEVRYPSTLSSSIDRKDMMQMVDYAILTTSDVSHNLRKEIHDSLESQLHKFFLQLLSSGQVGPSHESPENVRETNSSDVYKELYKLFMSELLELCRKRADPSADPRPSQGPIALLTEEAYTSFVSQLSSFVLELLPGGRVDPGHKPSESSVSETLLTQQSTIFTRELYESIMSQLPVTLAAILYQGLLDPSNEPANDSSEISPSPKSNCNAISKEDYAVWIANNSVDEAFTADSIIHRYTEQLGLVSIDNITFLKNNFFKHYLRAVKDEIKQKVEKKIRSAFAQLHF